jgi:FkbM family methyltransferase
MIIDFNYIYNKYRMNINGVVHVGAHYGEEIPFYLSANIDKIVCFEPLEENLAILELKKTKEVFIFPYALGEKEKTMEMNLSSNNLESSSLLNPKEHLYDYPGIQFNWKRQVEVKRLDSFTKEIEGCNYLSMDVQGYEYEVLLGAGDILNQFDYIYTEVNFGETYENNKLINSLDEYLFNFGFIRVETSFPARTWGDALYVKGNLL